jgi:hypothetical protein
VFGKEPPKGSQKASEMEPKWSRNRANRRPVVILKKVKKVMKTNTQTDSNMEPKKVPKVKLF